MRQKLFNNKLQNTYNHIGNRQIMQILLFRGKKMGMKIFESDRPIRRSDRKSEGKWEMNIYF